MQVVHCKKSKYDVYIGRPSKWGNPYSHLLNTDDEFRVKDVDEAIIAYEIWVRNKPELLSGLHEIKGKILGCWCYPKQCHGDVLIKLVDEFVK